MTTPVSQCTVIIQVWVDTKAVQAGSAKGVYMVDSRRPRRSQKRALGALQTAVARNAVICWTLLPIDPKFTAAGGTLQMQAIGNSNAWGAGGQPRMIDATTYTGSAQNAGTANYHISIDVLAPGKSRIALSLNPSMTVN